MTSRPNIVLVMTDSARWDTVRYAGNPHAVSPNLDRLAAEGVLFEQAHTAAPVCMPARCSLLTGVHTPVHGCIENGIDRRTDLSVFPDALAAAGYHNIFVGKSHFGPVPESFHAQHVLGGEKGHDVDDFYAEHIRPRGYSRASRHPNPVPEELSCDAFLIDTTIAEIEQHRQTTGGEPFFAWCSIPSPHSVLDPPGRWATLFDDRPLPPLNYVPGEEADQPAHLRRLVGVRGCEGRAVDHDGDLDYDAVDRERRLYYSLAAYCDAQIGRLMSYLDDVGLRQDTLVIYTSDHGQQYYDHGINDKHTYYDASWRVPLIMSMPGTLPQNVRDSLALHTDLTATILAAAGQDHRWVNGFDLFTPIADGGTSPRRCVVSVLYRSLALATSRWKLEYFPDERAGRLFDRRDDPDEQHDRYNDPESNDVRTALVEALLSWRAELTDVEHLQTRTHGGGPVAQRAAAYSSTLRGADPDRRLGDRVTALEQA